MKRDQIIKEALKIVNIAREALDLPRLRKLPVGTRECEKTCPLANALGAEVDGFCINFGTAKAATKVARAFRDRLPNTEERGDYAYAGRRTGRDVSLPDALCDFVDRFDRRQFPELIAPKALSKALAK